jgi:hypothetical protein
VILESSLLFLREGVVTLQTIKVLLDNRQTDRQINRQTNRRAALLARRNETLAPPKIPKVTGACNTNTTHREYPLSWSFVCWLLPLVYTLHYKITTHYKLQWHPLPKACGFPCIKLTFPPSPRESEWPQRNVGFDGM